MLEALRAAQEALGGPQPWQVSTTWANFDMRTWSDYGPGSNYTTSFCDNGDLLSQWRGYGLGFGGVAIGFDRSDLEFGADLLQVRYEKNEQLQASAARLLRDLPPRASRGANPQHPTLSPTSKDTVTRKLRRALLTHKHPAFREEGEWRVVVDVGIHARPPHVKQESNETVVQRGNILLNPTFRLGSEILIPYILLPLGRPGETWYKPIREVWIGPTSNPDLAKYSVESLLTTQGEHASVRMSEATLVRR
jgi:hypothetical protein